MMLFGPQLSIQNGGSDILSYELQMDNGNGGYFFSLIGISPNSLETSFLISNGLATGLMYRFRYRSKNLNGLSLWSPETYVLAATVPTRPPPPMFITATSTSITLSLISSNNTRGSAITAIQIWRNNGGDSLTYTNIVDLQNSVLIYTINLADSLGMLAGVIYKFKVRTLND